MEKEKEKEMEIEKIYTLSPMQKGMLFHYLKEENSRAYCELRFFTLEGEIDPGRLEQGIRYLVDRYDVLRTVFSYEKVKEPVQIVLKKRKFNLQFEDITRKPGEEQEKYLEDIKEKQGQKGFDLRKDLLTRVFLFKTGASTWKLLWIYHHIIMDGWCAAITFNQLIRVYNALKHDRPLQLKPAVPYREYIRWLKKQNQEQGLLYWQEYLDGIDRQTGLLGPAKPPAPHHYRLKEHRFIIPSSLRDRMNRLAIKHQATLFDLLKTTWGILLQKYNDTDDVVFGIVVSGRPPEIQGVGEMVGLFVNTIPIRIQTRGKQEIRQLLEQVHRETLSTRSYEYLPLADVQSRSALKENLIDHIMVYENHPPAIRGSSSRGSNETGFSVTHLETYEQTGYDLNVLVMPGRDLAVVFNYNAAVYETGILEKTANRYLNLLNEVTGNPDREISKIEIVTAEEKEEILLKFNDTRQETPRDKTIHGIFAEQAKRTPDHMALLGPKLQITNYKSQTNYKLQITNKEVPPGEITNYKLQITNKEVPFGQFVNAFGEMEADGAALPVQPVQPVRLVRPDQPVQLTYRQIDEQTDRQAYKLLEKGVEPETIVAIMVDRSIEMIIGILAILKSGGAYMPIDPGNPGEHIDYLLKDSEAKILLTANEIASLSMECAATPEAFLNLSEGRPYTHHSSFIEAFHHSSNLAYVIYTSGTTGRPKGVMEAHSSVVNLLYALQQKYPVTGTDAYLLKTAYVFDVSVAELFGWYLGGGRLVILEKHAEKEPARILDSIARFGITHIDFVPSMFKVLAAELNHTGIGQLARLKYIFLAGEVLAPALVEKFRRLPTAIPLENLYGPTEAAVYASMYSLTQWEGGRIPIGKPLPNVELYILDKWGFIQPIGIPGELCIGGIGLARGYLNKPGLTAEKFCLRQARGFLLNLPEGHLHLRAKSQELRAKFYRSGDLARWLPDGNIEFLGRKDDQVKIRGYRIEPGEIENRLTAYPHIKEAVVVTREDKTGDRYLCAYIVTVNRETPGKNPDITGELKQYLARLIPGYMVPTYFVTLEEIPLTPSGKIDRKRLPAPGMKGLQEYTAPQTLLEMKLVEIWSEVLGIPGESIGIEQNFFDLGGHSLKATLMITRVHKELNIKLPLEKVFKTPRIRELSQYIKRNTGDKYDKYISLQPVEKKEYYPVSSAQKRLYILHRLEPHKTVYNMPQVIRLGKDADQKRLAEVFRKLIARHESLRTSIIIIEGEPVQRIYDEVEFEVEEVAPLSKVFGSPEPFFQKGFWPPEAVIKNFIRPFDLSKVPLLRVEWIKSSEGEYLLFIDLHHIITDGTSDIILRKEFMSYYAGGELPPLKLQYKDFSGWQNSKQQREMLKTQEAYWLKVYMGEKPVLELPIDNPRPVMQSFAGGSVDFIFEEEETQRMKRMTRETGATLYMVILSVYTILLAKLSGQEDIVVGTPIAARRHADLEQIIGMFVNTLAIRNFPSAGKSGKEFLEEVKERTLQAYENQEYQFEDLVEKVAVRRDTGRNPIFDVMFNLLNQGDNTGEIRHPEEGEARPNRHREGTAKFDLNLAAIDLGNRIFFHLEYSSQLFNTGTIDKIIGYFRNTAASLEINDHFKISALEILTEGEKKEILDLSRGPARENEPGETLHGWYEAQAVQTPDQIAVVGPQSEAAGPGTTFVTYHQLNRQSDRMAGYLREQGVRRDMVVGLMAGRSIEMIVGILAIIKAGGAYLPIDAQYPGPRIKYMLGDSDVKHLVTNYEIKKAGELIPAGIEIIDMRKLKGELGDGPRSTQSMEEEKPTGITITTAAASTSLIYVIYTSGTTGKPKGVLLEHRNLVNLIRYQQRETNIDSSRVLQFATLSFDASVHEIFTALLAGGTLYLVDRETRTDIPALFKLIGKNDIKTLFLPMSFLKSIFQEEEYVKRIPAGITHIQTAGEQVIIDNNFREYLKRTGVNLHNHYGPSEAHVVTTLTLAPHGEIPPLPPIGKPVSNTHIYILDKSKHLLPIGIPGELYIGGLQVGRGYLNNPELTSEKFIMPSATKNPFEKGFLDFPKLLSGHPSPIAKQLPEGHLHLTLNTQHLTLYRTGDLAKWNPDGNIEILGRIDHQVKIRGNRVEPGEIETRLLEHEAVKEAIVAIGQEPNRDKYLCAYIVTNREVTAREMQEYLGGNLPDYMVPAYFVTIEKMPLTPSGKIDRQQLPSPDIKAIGKNQMPQTALEQKIAGIWSEVLGIAKEKIGIEHNFFELGGHSLKAMQLAAKMEKQGIKVTINQIFIYGTIGKLAELIEKTKQEKETETRIKEPEAAEKELKKRQGIHSRLIRYHILKNETPVYVLYVEDTDIHRLDEVQEAIRENWDKEIQPQYIKEMSKMPPGIDREGREPISLSREKFAALMGLKKLK